MSDEELLHAGINLDTGYRSQLKNLRVLENEYQYYDRSKDTMKKLIKLHEKRGGTILLVAHAPSLEVLTRHLMNGQPRPDRLAELAGKVDYCSMTIVEGDPASKTWRFRSSLDPRINWQQQQTSVDRSASYVPSAVLGDYS
jgi:broad specificity phosphatase PhoE